MNTWSDPDEPALADVQQEFPEWDCRTGVNRLCFARRGDVLVRGEDPRDLREAIRLALSRDEQAAWQAAHSVTPAR